MPSQLPDPLAGLPAPDTSGLPTNPAPNGTVYSPGVYTGAFSPSGTLLPGIYVLQGGLCLAGNTSLTGSGVLLYITGSCADGNAVSITGNAFMSISPYASEPYAGMSIWSATSAPILIAGNGQGTSVNGLLYAPTSTSVTLGTGGGTIFIGSVIAPNINAAGNGQSPICIGYADIASCTAA
jgi:hypothetical protein